MRPFLLLALLWVTAAVWQTGVNGLPRYLHVDLGLLMGLCGLAFLRTERALLFLFVLGLQSDLLGSGRFGLLTAAYLLAGGMLIGIRQELSSSGWRVAALAAIGGTMVAHGFYFLISAFSSFGLGWLAGGRMWLELTLAAAIWAWPVAWLLRTVWAWMGLLAPEVQLAEAQQLERRQGRMRVRRA